MSDTENIPQSEPNVAPETDGGTYPPSWFPAQPPPSPAQLAEQLRLSRIPPDLRVPWGWTDVGVFLLFYLGSTIVLLIIAMIAASAIRGIPFDALKQHPVLVIVLSIVAQTAGSFAALFYFWVLARVRHAGRFWPALGWHSLDGTHTTPATVIKYLFAGVAMAIAIAVLGSLIKQAGPTPFDDFFKARQTVFMLMAFGILIAPLVEETVFRGFLYPVAARQFGVMPGVLLTGILFGGFHAMQLWGAWGQIALLVLVGIVLTWVRARTGSVLAGFLMHVAYNSTLFAATYFGTHGFRDFPVGK